VLWVFRSSRKICVHVCLSLEYVIFRVQLPINVVECLPVFILNSVYQNRMVTLHSTDFVIFLSAMHLCTTSRTKHSSISIVRICTDPEGYHIHSSQRADSILQRLHKCCTHADV